MSNSRLNRLNNTYYTYNLNQYDVSLNYTEKAPQPTYIYYPIYYYFDANGWLEKQLNLPTAISDNSKNYSMYEYLLHHSTLAATHFVLNYIRDLIVTNSTIPMQEKDNLFDLAIIKVAKVIFENQKIYLADYKKPFQTLIESLLQGNDDAQPLTFMQLWHTPSDEIKQKFPDLLEKKIIVTASCENQSVAVKPPPLSFQQIHEQVYPLCKSAQWGKIQTEPRKKYTKSISHQTTTKEEREIKLRKFATSYYKTEQNLELTGDNALYKFTRRTEYLLKETSFSHSIWTFYATDPGTIEKKAKKDAVLSSALKTIFFAYTTYERPNTKRKKSSSKNSKNETTSPEKVDEIDKINGYKWCMKQQDQLERENLLEEFLGRPQM